MAEAAAVTEERRAEFKAKITAFISSSDEKVAFPASLTMEERRAVHDLAYYHDLCKRSRGPKNNGRFIEVSKPTGQQKVQMAEQKKRRVGAVVAGAAPARPRSHASLRSTAPLEWKLNVRGLLCDSVMADTLTDVALRGRTMPAA